MRRKESIPIDIFRYQIVRIADASMNQNIGISIRTLKIYVPYMGLYMGEEPGAVSQSVSHYRYSYEYE